MIARSGRGLHFASHADGRAALAVRGRADWRILQMTSDGSVSAKAGGRALTSGCPAVREIAMLMTPGFFGSAIYR